MLKRAFVLPVLLAFVAWAGWVRPTPAAEAVKPLAVVSFAGMDQLNKDLEAIGAMAGNPGLKDLADGALKMATLGKGLSGLDTTRPWGVVVPLNPMQAYAFLPVTDLKELADTVATLSGKPLTQVDGAYKIDTPQQTVFIKQIGKWAIAGALPDVLAAAPAEPAAALAELPKKYALAISLLPGNMPAEMMDLYLGMALAGALEQAPLRQAISEKQLDEFRRAIKDLDEITLGLGVDATAKKVHLDLLVTAKAGSKLAETMAASQSGTSQYAALAEAGAALVGSVASKVAADQVQQQLAWIEKGQTELFKKLEEQPLPEASMKEAKAALGQLFDVARATCKLAKSDAGVSISFDEKNGPVLVAGGILAEGAKLESALKKMRQLALDMAPDATLVEKLVKLDAEKHQGFRFHTVTMPLDDAMASADPGGKRFLATIGDKLTLVLAIGDEGIVVGLGKDPAAAVKQAIDKTRSTSSASAVLPLRVAVSGAALARMVAAFGDPSAQEGAKAVAAVLTESGGKDHLSLTGTAIERGVRVRLELEEGVLKAAGFGVKMASGAR